MMDRTVRVFVSSTWQDLQPERNAVEKALHRMQNTTFRGMEYFGSRPETPQEVSLTEVDQSDVYVGIFAHRYGSGITEAEYRRAQERGIPCLIYLIDDNVPVLPSNLERESDKTARLDTLKQELKSHHTVSFFKNPDQLATQVVADLHNLFGSAPSVREEKPIQPSPKFQISITDSQGVVIGDQTNVTQILTEPKPTRQRNFIARSSHQLVQVKGEHRIYLVNKDGSRSWVPDGPTLESLARWEDVELLASWDELERFPPKLPLPSIVYGIKPWLVKVRGEQDIYLIDKTGIRHRIKDLGSDRTLDERTEVDFFASWKEMELYQLGQPLSNIRLASGSETNIHLSNTLSTMTDIRLQHLADNIRQDLALLKDYEDAFRFEDDPRRCARYRREIEQLRNSAINYQKEYDELCTLSSLNTPEDTQVIATQLQQMGTKLDGLLAGQSAIRSGLKDLRQSVLTHYDASVQSIIATIVERLDQNQVSTVLAIQEVIEADRISEDELQTILATVQQTLSEIQRYQEESRNSEMAGNIQRISEVINEPKLNVRQRLKITLPIIPLLMKYEGEFELSEAINLENAWKLLVVKARNHS